MSEINKLKLTLANVELTQAFGRALGQAVVDSAMVALTGPLGAGKTCLVQGVGEALGVTEPIVSPTFTMLNEYHSGRLPLYHLDLYRVADDPITQAAVGGKSLELLRTELDEFIYGPGVVLIEWAEHILAYLTDYLLIEIDYFENEQGRSVSVSGVGSKSIRLIRDINSSVIYT